MVNKITDSTGQVNAYQPIDKTVDEGKSSDPETVNNNKVSDQQFGAVALEKVADKNKEQNPETDRISELLMRVPEEERGDLYTLLEAVPENIQDKYIKTIEGALHNKDEVAVRTSIRGAAFELSRIYSVMKQGFEQVDFDLQIPDKVHFIGYTKKDGFSAEPTKEYDSAIELDVPITRDGKAYIYETKSYPRMQFGSLPNQRNG